uniref:Nose resistant-to-fluoxetine protein N-terminal domain-containing protein n=1 Tax=Strigamia maritima TaxID=126957 RepID=T1J952_STRMM
MYYQLKVQDAPLQMQLPRQHPMPLVVQPPFDGTHLKYKYRKKNIMVQCEDQIVKAGLIRSSMKNCFSQSRKQQRKNIFMCNLLFVINVNLVVTADDILQNFNLERVAKTIDDHKNINKSNSFKPDHEFEPFSIFQTPELALDRLQNYSNPNISRKCVQDVFDFVFALAGKEGWAWSMLDAYGKIGSGISQGNFIWPGSFSVCNDVTQGPPYVNSSKPFHGQYCWVIATVSKESMPNVPVQQDISLRTAVCVPDSCTPENLNYLMADINAIPKLNHSVVLSSNCIPPSRNIWNDQRAVICLVFCFLMAAIIVTATLYDMYIQFFNSKSQKITKKEEAAFNAHNNLSYEVEADSDNNPLSINVDNKPLVVDNNKKKQGICEQILLCFSFYTNASKLFNTEPRDNSLMCINGIRVISMFWIIFGHSYMMGALSADNIVVPFNWVSSFSFLFIVQAVFSVDTFFVLSGLLVTYLYMKEHEKRNGKISWLKFYFHRYWRLTPVYAVVLFLFYNILSPYYINGPFWSEQGLGGDNCDKHWWMNLLYINNFMDFNELCMGHTWYLANDMQHLPVSAIIAGVLILASWITTGAIATYFHISHSFLNSATDDSMNRIYDKPYCRIAPYLIGMICGYLLHKSKCEAKLNKVVVAVGWLIAFGLSSAVMFGTYNVTLNQGEQSLYLALSRSAWSVALAWVIFACCSGYGGVVNSILSWPFWQPFGRLTYSTYLIHLAIIPLFVLGEEVPPHFSHLLMFSIFFSSAACSYFAAIFISLSFEAPAFCFLIAIIIVLGTLYDMHIHFSNSKSAKSKTITEATFNTRNNSSYEVETESEIHPQSVSDSSIVLLLDKNKKKPGIYGNILLCFSFYTNASKLFNTEPRDNSLMCINGIRVISMLWIILGHSYMMGAYYTVDTFFVLSGLLVTLTPVYAAVLFLFYNVLSPYYIDGPFWSAQAVNGDNCDKNWWKNLLYINNFISNSSEVVCLFYRTFFRYLSVSAIIADEVYERPYCRIAPYIIGMICGYLLHRNKCELKLNKIVVSVGWLIAVVLSSVVMFGTYHSEMNQGEQSLYLALSRSAWSVALVWMIFAFCNGYGGMITTFCFLMVAMILIGSIYDMYIHLSNNNLSTSKSQKLKKKTQAVFNIQNKLSQEYKTEAEINIHSSIDADNKSLTNDNNKMQPAMCRQIFLCFSFYTNASKLFNTESRDNTLMCINGIRVISMLWIILGHCYSMGVLAAIFSVDTFFVLRLAVYKISHNYLELIFDIYFSGLLVTYLFLKEQERSNGKISWLKFYFHRYWRLTPVYAVLLFLFYDILFPYYIDGPFWSQTIQRMNGEKCDKYWWANLLYINNFVDFNNMMFTNFGNYCCFDTFDKIYAKPYCRIAPYIIGMICGYLLYRCKCVAKLNKVVVVAGWFIAVGLSSAVMFGTYNSVLTQDVESFYLALSRSAWSVALAWMIFACCNGYGGVVNSILSWPFWQPFGRICGKIFLCFSFYTNALKLFNTEPRDSSLMCLNGIRVFSMGWIILGHCYATGALATDNVLVPQAMFAVDTFFVLSGLLVTYLYLKEHEKKDGKISWLKFYFHRYWRLTPVYAVVLFLFYNILSPYYIDSPFWSDQGLSGDKCDKYWWVNLLYINNLLDLSDSCMGHTWYLANDMQFFVISPLILIFLTRYVPVSAIIAGSFILINWIATGVIATCYNVTDASTNFSENFDKIYIKPYCRIAPYIIGMICGYLLHRNKCQAKFNKIVVAAGWLIAFGLSSAVVFGIYHSHSNQDGQSFYLALSRSTWSVALAWLIFACCNGYGGIVNSILSWPFWQPLGRLTYSTYLIHLAIIPIFVMGSEVPPHFSHILMFSIFFASAACSYFAA